VDDEPALARAVATHRPCEGELFQFSVELPAAFPDCLDELRTQAARGLDDIEATAVRLYGATDTETKD
jgi:hypothetical protein